MRILTNTALIAVTSLTLLGSPAMAQLTKKLNNRNMETLQVHYRNVKAKGLNIFYREAGQKDAPTILLLHGYPTSSHMYRNLIPILSSQYHVLAPDLPGFGYSDAPDHFPVQLYI